MRNSCGGIRLTSVVAMVLALGAVLAGTVGTAAPASAETHDAVTPSSDAAWLDDAPPPAGTMGQQYSFTFAATGLPTPTVSITTGTLPQGLSMDTAGNVTGTPTQSGRFTFTVAADNGIGARSLIQATIVVHSLTNYTNIGTSNTSTAFTFWFKRAAPDYQWDTSVANVNLMCPPETPYLINQHLAPGRIVPHGIHISITNATGRVDNVGVSAGAAQHNGYQAGVKDLSATLWNGATLDGPTNVVISLHCTNNPAGAKPF